MNVYVIHVHPGTDSFSHECRRRAVATLEAAGHEVRVSDLYADGFDPVTPLAERRGQFDDPATKAVAAPYLEHLHWANALVFIYPTWWSGPPAMLKGWFDRVWIAGAVYTLPANGNRIRGMLHSIRRIVVITTHGSSKVLNAIQGEPGKRLIFRSIRLMCHPLTRTRWLALYSMDTLDTAGRTAFLRRVERSLRRL